MYCSYKNACYLDNKPNQKPIANFCGFRLKVKQRSGFLYTVCLNYLADCIDKHSFWFYVKQQSNRQVDICAST
ncbi:hypothetical protein CP500_008240 [Tychonema bourrellyi FEM_GT703]|uniref:Uncharacterized protein n=1 Tax=Tychonema bourrellyi FEM_GT703 TaxID=2040638 RepID=A0A2G4F2G5_9CYAN|nr:hypothetical protein CP500_008240 [Tychonema bourrellyi FEM_GT703]